jgi:hypothetical protein
VAAAGCVPAPPALDLPPTSPPMQAGAPVAAFGFRPSGGGGSAPSSAAATTAASPPGSTTGGAASASPPIAAPAAVVPVPVMEPFRHLLMTPSHEAAVAIAGGHLRRSLLLGEVESKYVQYGGGWGKNATKRRQRHRAKLEEQTREYSGVLGREAGNDALLRPAVGGCVVAFAAVNASDRADDIVLERLPLATDAELDAGRYKFAAAAATMPSVGTAMAVGTVAPATAAASYGGGGGGGGGGYYAAQQPPVGGGSAPGGSAGSPYGGGGGGGGAARSGGTGPVATTTTYRGGGGGIAMGGGGGSSSQAPGAARARAAGARTQARPATS